MFNIHNVIPPKIHTWQKYQNTFLFLLFFRRKRINVQLIRSTHPHNKCTIHYSFLFWLLLFFCSFFSITIIPSHWKDKVYSRCCCVPLWTPLRKVHTQYAVPPRRPHSRCCLAIVRHSKGCLLFSILSVIFIFIFLKSQIVTLNITIFNSIQM